jgi:hypothetical protein
MDAAWIAVIGTISGGLLVGGLAIVSKIIELRVGRQREIEDRQRQRLEELHLLLGDYVSACHEFSQFLIGHKITTPDKGDQVARFGTQVRAIASLGFRVSSLQRIYAPEAEERWHSILQQCALFTQDAALFTEHKVSAARLNQHVQIIAERCLGVFKIIEAKMNKTALSAGSTGEYCTDAAHHE